MTSTSQAAPRRVESGLAWFTLMFVAVFAPVETAVSWSYGLASPYYVVDAIAIVLLAWGVWLSLRARPGSSPAVLTVGWAWAGANFWRATMSRVDAVREGWQLGFGNTELVLAFATTGLAIVGVVVGLWLLTRTPQKRTPSGTTR